MLPTIARDLGVRDLGRPAPRPADRVGRAGRCDLIVLDNFEQVVPAAPDVLALLTALPGATVLVTSRARLRCGGARLRRRTAWTFRRITSGRRIAEMLAAPAVRMFRDRARAADPRFDLTDENAADVARICQALDGVPLAIELAAIRIRALTPSAMLARLDRVLPAPDDRSARRARSGSAPSARPSSGASTC